MKSKEMQKKLNDITKKGDDNCHGELCDFFKEIHAGVITINIVNDHNALIQLCQARIQAQAAVETIGIAKRSCRWAALAAVCSLIIILMTINYEIVLEKIFSLLNWISCLI